MTSSLCLGVVGGLMALPGAVGAAQEVPTQGFPLQFVLRSPDGRHETFATVLVQPGNTAENTERYIFARNLATFRDDSFYQLLISYQPQSNAPLPGFMEAPTTVPAPGACALMAAAGLCILRRQRAHRAGLERIGNV